ncbi:MAG: GDP-L-fucose synthase [Candidatus Azotimanducaceae bacterium]|jgi:GDP-L-fucose synthase
MISTDSKIYIAGHQGMVGAAILRKLNALGYKNILLQERSQLDLLRQTEVESFFLEEKPDYTFIAAAKVGGIQANQQYPAEFIYENLVIETNLINGAYRAGCYQLMFLGSSCIYPKYAEQPIEESTLLQSTLEPTNEFYAIAKIAGLKMCEAYNRQYGTDYRCLMPTNLYGPNDNFHPENSHVISALINRFHLAKKKNLESVTIWGTGEAQREFLHVDDLADACCYIAATPEDEYRAELGSRVDHLNVGTGTDIKISALSRIIANLVGFQGSLEFDTQKPDGTPRKLLDVSKINSLGWHATTDLASGLASTYEWFLKNQSELKNHHNNLTID